MQRFVESYPELKAQGSLVSKHVTLLSEITSAVEGKRECATLSTQFDSWSRYLVLSSSPFTDIFELSEVEQNVACNSDASEHFTAVCEVLRIPGIDPIDALRLLMIFALRYEKTRPEKVRGNTTKLGLPNLSFSVDDLLYLLGNMLP
jgi:hypothetical protein